MGPAVVGVFRGDVDAVNVLVRDVAMGVLRDQAARIAHKMIVIDGEAIIVDVARETLDLGAVPGRVRVAPTAAPVFPVVELVVPEILLEIFLHQLDKFFDGRLHGLGRLWRALADKADLGLGFLEILVFLKKRYGAHQIKIENRR